jgi:hypothetical protein
MEKVYKDTSWKTTNWYQFKEIPSWSNPIVVNTFRIQNRSMMLISGEEYSLKTWSLQIWGMNSSPSSSPCDAILSICCFFLFSPPITVYLLEKVSGRAAPTARAMEASGTDRCSPGHGVGKLGCSRGASGRGWAWPQFRRGWARVNSASERAGLAPASAMSHLGGLDGWGRWRK